MMLRLEPHEVLRANHCTKIADGTRKPLLDEEEQELLQTVQDNDKTMAERKDAGRQLIENYNYGKKKIRRMLAPEG
jgi:hypothetical protein